MKDMIKSKRNEEKIDWIYYTAYSIVFFLTALFILECFRSAGKSMIQQGDAYIQGYPNFVKEINYVKELLHTIFIDHKLELPMIDYTIGFGMDAIVNVWKFPFILLGVICPARYYDNFYEFLSLFCLYYAGLTFSAYCRKIEYKNRLSILSGCFVYLFCGYALFSVSRYISFIYPMIYLPLCLIGVEDVITKSKINILVIFTGILFIRSWYFGYIVSILVVLYCIIRIIPTIKSRKYFIRKSLQLIGSYLLGIFLSAVFLLPSVYEYLQSCRTNGTNYSLQDLLRYDFGYYKGLTLGLFVPAQTTSYEMFISLLPVAIPSLIILFLNNSKKINGAKAAVIMVVLFAIIPLFGRLFNGGGYISNRWSFAMSFVFAIVVVIACTCLDELSDGKKNIIFLVCIVLGLVYLFIELKYKTTFYGVASAILTLHAIIIALHIQWKSFNKKLLKASWCGLALCSGFVYIFFYYHPMVSSYTASYKDENTDEILQSYYLSEISNIDDNSFFRVDTPWNESDYSLYYNYNGTAIYNSTLSDNVSSFFYELSLNTERYAFQLTGLDRRAVLDELFDVKYYACSSGAAPGIYNYDLYYTGENGDIYKKNTEAQLIHTYSNYMQKSDYLKLTPLQRQEALIQTVIVDEPFKNMPEAAYCDSYKNVAYEISGLNGVELENNQIKATEANAKMTLSFNSPKNTETYLVIKGLSLSSDAKIYNCFLNSNGITNQMVFIDKGHQYYVGDTVTINLGYSESGLNECIIIFPQSATLSYEKISIVSYPMESYEEDCAKLSEDSLDNAVISTNSVEGTVNLSEEKLVQFSIPYSKGWTAYVDGKEVPLYKTDTMWMSLLLDSGQHDIKLQYRTPLLAAGIAISLLAIVVLLAINIIASKKRRYAHISIKTQIKGGQ